MNSVKSVLVLGVCAVFMLAGCASSGNAVLKSETETSVKDKLVEGKSTKSDVRNIYGAPMKTSFTDNGSEIWTYEFSNMSADAISYVPIVNLFARSASGTKKELVVLYDKSDVVQRFTMSESNVTVKGGLAN
ncbi:MAG: hypothetical protein JOY60_16095 [Burkholderiaceae bacterium]|nr:hypothetical protein [Burkholderiaceae bacterium]